MKQTQTAVDYKLLSVTSPAFKSNEITDRAHTAGGKKYSHHSR
jgi:hypothetical protein